MNAITKDYLEFLDEIGLTPEAVEAALRKVEVDGTACKDIAIDKSGIAGQGVFADRAFNAGEVVAPIMVNDRWTKAGRYTNHSPKPNVLVRRRGNTVEIVACEDIFFGREITANYRQVKAVIGQ